MAGKPKFDAAGFFESQGLSFKGFDKSGQALVENMETGERGTFNVKQMLASDGMDTNAEITYNTPDNPLNESPVGVLDRLKLSLGNTKGGAEYLKQKFQGAQVDSAGNLVVKDGGAWKRVDLDGVGDETGWKVSEMLADVADLTGDAIVGAGGLAGAVGGGGLGSVATAMAGSAAASGAKAALGRIVGTYDATPEEVIKDIALDGLLGAVGEGVALGAKHMVLPTIAKGFKKIGSLGEAAQDTMAKALSALDDEGVDAYRTMFANSEEVVGMARKYQDEAVKRATIRGAEQVTKEGLPETASVLYRTIAEEEATKAARPLIENAQGNLSNWYGRELDSIINESIRDVKSVSEKVVQNATQIQNQVERFLGETGLGVTEGKVRRAMRPAEIMEYFERAGAPIPKEVAGRLAGKLTSLRSFASGLSKNTARTPKDFKNLLNMTRNLDEIFDSLPPNIRNTLESSGFQPLANLDTAISNALPDKFKQSYGALRGGYREKKALVNSIAGPLYSRNSTATFDTVGRKLVDVMKESSRGSAQAKIALKTLADITPGGQEHVQHLAKRNAAMVLAGYRSSEAHTLYAIAARGTASAVRSVAVPAANLISKLQRRASLKGFLAMPGYQRFAQTAKLIKNGGQAVTANPELLGAGLTTMLSALQDDMQ